MFGDVVLVGGLPGGGEFVLVVVFTVVEVVLPAIKRVSFFIVATRPSG